MIHVTALPVCYTWLSVWPLERQVHDCVIQPAKSLKCGTIYHYTLYNLLVTCNPLPYQPCMLPDINPVP